MLRATLSCVLWVLASWLVAGAARLAPPRPRRKVLEVDGARLVPVAELPRERVLVPPEQWLSGLMFAAAFGTDEGRA